MVQKHLENLQWALRRPDRVRPKLEGELRRAARLLRTGRVPELVGSLGEALLGANPYVWYVRRATGTRYVERDVFGNRMVLDVTDAGMQRTLVHHGVWERHSTAAFRGALRRLRDARDGPLTALDVGANVGYYALMEADLLGPDVTVHAVEPVDENAALLARNVERNGFGDRVTIDRCAVGATSGTATLRLDETHGNLHRVVDSARASSPVEAVEMRSAADLLSDHGREPADVDVVRMDVEGAEYDILVDAPDLLAGDPAVLFLEVHPGRLGRAAFVEVLEAIEATGARVVRAVDGSFDVPLDVDGFGPLYRREDSFELVVERPPAS